MKTKIILAIIIVDVIIAVSILGYLLKKYYYTDHTTTEVKNEQQDEFSDLQDGDIIFQESQSSQCRAIQLATGSRYSHCGIIFKKDGKLFVYEAIQPVTYTQLRHWIKRGKDEHYVVKRLKNADEVLTPENKTKLIDEAKKHINKDYDLTFEWSDDKIYCSELIWKIYKRGAGIEVGQLQKLKDFDLSHPIVKEKIEERYGENIPLDESAISPKEIFDSKLIYTVQSN